MYPQIQFYLVLLKDKPDDPEGMQYNLYFVNDTDEEICGMQEEAVDSFPSEVPVFSNVTKKERPKVPARGFICIEAENDYGLDFTTYYEFFFNHGGKSLKLDFIRKKYFFIIGPVPKIMGEDKVGLVYLPKITVID